MNRVLVKVMAKGDEVYRQTYDIEVGKDGEIERVLKMTMDESGAARTYEMNGDLGLSISPA